MAVDSKIGDNFLTTTVSGVVNWARKGRSGRCPLDGLLRHRIPCRVGLGALRSGALRRRGRRFRRASPTCSWSWARSQIRRGPVLKRIYDQMPDPKWVISMGACATSGGFYRAYHVHAGH